MQDSQDLDRLRVAAEPGRHRQRDRHHLLGHVELAVDHLVADESDARDLLQGNFETFLRISAELLAVDQWRGAGDRQESDIQLRLFQRLLFLRDSGERVDREDARERAQESGGTDRAQQRAAQNGVGEEAMQQRRLDAARDLVLPRGC